MIIQKKYSGITVPVLTPVLEDETVDEQGYRRLIKYMLDNGIHGIFSCGTLGETMFLTQAERDRAIRIAADECNGKAKAFAGVMDTSTKRVIGHNGNYRLSQQPFNGHKLSGFGSEGTMYTLHEMVKVKTIVLKNVF